MRTRGLVQDALRAQVLETDVPYVYDPFSNRIDPASAGTLWPESMGNLDALAYLPDGSILFSLAEDRFVAGTQGAGHLRDENAYSWDPLTGGIALFFDGAALGLLDLDAIDFDANQRLVFSTATDCASGGTLLRHRSAYTVEQDGTRAERISGTVLQLQSLDALSLIGSSQPGT